MIAATFPATAQQATNINITRPAPATTQVMTEAQCRAFKGLLTDHIRVTGRENLSDGFVSAMVDFAINRKCAGPASIPTAGREIDVFNSISGLMEVTYRIDMDKIGLRQVKRTAALGLGTN
jgi:hypothetical protein